jgi:uncharacterized protein
VITEEEKNTIIRCSKKYGVSTVVLFGSSLEKDNARDIDLAVDGIEPVLFFKFFGELIKELPKPVDLVDLSYKSLFNDIVRETGVVIYG